MTEDEAKTKWCPFVRLARPGQTAFNRTTDDSELLPAAMCVASDCMAWRWKARTWPSKPNDQSGPICGGYCGLAGETR